MHVIREQGQCSGSRDSGPKAAIAHHGVQAWSGRPCVFPRAQAGLHGVRPRSSSRSRMTNGSIRAALTGSHETEAMREVKAPSRPGLERRVFLAGSIEMGKAEQWQERIVAALSGAGDLVILNPRRDDWDDSWEQRATWKWSAGGTGYPCSRPWRPDRRPDVKTGLGRRGARSLPRSPSPPRVSQPAR